MKTYICGECSPGGAHPQFVTEHDYLDHRRQAHGQEIPITPGEVQEEVQSNPKVQEAMDKILAALKPLLDLDKRVKAIEDAGKKQADGPVDNRSS